MCPRPSRRVPYTHPQIARVRWARGQAEDQARWKRAQRIPVVIRAQRAEPAEQAKRSPASGIMFGCTVASNISHLNERIKHNPEYN